MTAIRHAKRAKKKQVNAWRTKAAGAALAIVMQAISPSTTPASAASMTTSVSHNELEIGRIVSDFRLSMFGVIDFAGIVPTDSHQLVILVSGPNENLSIDKKFQKLGMWIGVERQAFINVPAAKIILTSRPLSTISSQLMLAGYGILFDADLAPDRTLTGTPLDGAQEIENYVEALVRLKQKAELYTVHEGTVEFINPTFFRATAQLQPNLPIGRYTINYFLFGEDQTILATSSNWVWIESAGVKQQALELSRNQSLLYGLATLALCMLIAVATHVALRRD